MSTVLVAYSSKHGATAEIAEAIAGELRTNGIDADCHEAADVDDVSRYDAVVLGSAVYMKRWLRPARRLLSHAARELGKRPLWLFSSGPCGVDPDPSWSQPKKVVHAAKKLGAHEHVVFGGRLPLEPDGFIERGMVEKTPPEQRDMRDWDEIRAWSRSIAAQLKVASA